MKAEKRQEVQTFAKKIISPWLLERAGSVDSSGKGADAPAEHQELVDGLVGEVVVGAPDQLLQVLFSSVIVLTWLDDRVHVGHLCLVVGPNLDLAAIFEERLVGAVVDERVEESVLRLDVGEQGLGLVQQGD